MGLFIGRQNDLKIVELFNLEAKLCAINHWKRQAITFCLYRDPIYSTMYGIMKPYKNSNRDQIQ